MNAFNELLRCGKKTVIIDSQVTMGACIVLRYTGCTHPFCFNYLHSLDALILSSVNGPVSVITGSTLAISGMRSVMQSKIQLREEKTLQ